MSITYTHTSGDHHILPATSTVAWPVAAAPPTLTFSIMKCDGSATPISVDFKKVGSDWVGDYKEGQQDKKITITNLTVTVTVTVSGTADIRRTGHTVPADDTGSFTGTMNPMS